MNEKLQYATMLEIPVNTCSITTKPIKKKRTKKKKQVNAEQVKQQLLNKINQNEDYNQEQSVADDYDNDNTSLWEKSYNQAMEDIKEENSLPEYGSEYEQTDNLTEQENSGSSVTISPLQTKKKRRFSIIGAQFIVVGVLAFTILITNLIYPNSGINTFFKSVFSSNAPTTVDSRTYADFAPVIAMGNNDGVNMTNGVISFGGKGSIYAPCDGVVSSILKGEDGTFTIEITHNQNFKTLLSGVEYAYVGLDDKVFFNIPVGYLDPDGATMCFTNGQGSLISDYQIIDNMVVWAV